MEGRGPSSREAMSVILSNASLAFSVLAAALSLALKDALSTTNLREAPQPTESLARLVELFQSHRSAFSCIRGPSQSGL